MVEDLGTLGFGVFVGDVDEVWIEDELVVWELLVDDELCECCRVSGGDVCCLTFGVLGGGGSADSFVECRAAVAGVDSEGLAVGVAQWLDDGDGKGTDLGGYAFVGDAVVYAEFVGGGASLEFFPSEVFCDVAGVFHFDSSNSISEP